jgi:flagellar motor switch protein FliM
MAETANKKSIATGRGAGHEGQIVKYGFTQPTGLSAKFNQNLTTIGESFAKQLGFNLANFVRANVEIELKSIERSLFRDYVGRFENPSCIGIFSVPPLKGQALVSADPKLMFVILEKLVGGGGEPPEEARDFTEIETRIFTVIFNKFLVDLKEAAKRTLDLTPSLSRLESNPSFINTMTGGEKAIVMNLQLAIGEQTGAVSFCFSMSGFEPVLDKIDPKEEGIVRTEGEVQEDQQRIIATLDDAPVEIVAELGSTGVAVDALLNLQVGDTVILDHPAGEPINVKVGRTTMFLGQPGKSQNRKAVKITRVNDGGQA